MKTSPAGLRLLLGTLLALALTGWGWWLPLASQAQSSRSAARPLPVDEVRLFTEALERIRVAYVEEMDDKTLLENAVRGMLAGLDPYSAYLTGRDYEAFQQTTTGKFGGLGIEVSAEEGYIRVISPLDGTPAARAGIRAGDLITRIDDRPLRQLTTEQAAALMRGEPGTEVTVTVSRAGTEPFTLTIKREIIAVDSVRSMMLKPQFLYLRISQFLLNTGLELETELRNVLADPTPLKGIVLDLRNNPGGVLQSSVRTVDHFINQGRIVSTEGRLEGSDLEFYATADTLAPDTPLVVLINHGSASASEIVAGALQDHGRAVIMGTRSFGKGSVQTVLPLNEASAIKLTTSLYFTPAGRSIQAQGVIPDIKVDDAFVTRRGHPFRPHQDAAPEARPANGNDEAAALSDTTEGPQGLLSAEEVLVTDYPLHAALTVLQGMAVLRADG